MRSLGAVFPRFWASFIYGESTLKRMPAKKRPRKAKLTTRGATATETGLLELSGDALAAKAAVERSGGIVTGQHLEKPPNSQHPDDDFGRRDLRPVIYYVEQIP